MSTNGDGLVYKRGRIYWIQFSYLGKVYRESTKSGRYDGMDEQRAIRLLGKRITERDEKGEVIGPKKEKVRLKDLTDLIRNDYIMKNRKSKDRMLEPILKRFAANFDEDTRAINIDEDKINAYKTTRLNDGAAPSTINNELAILKHMFILSKKKLGGWRPEIEKLEVDNVRKGFFEEADFRALLNHLPPEIQPIAKFAFFTGFRKSEILNLQWRQVDFEGGEIRLEVGTTKNKEGRTFPFIFLPELAELIQNQRKLTDTVEWERQILIPWVFHRNGKPIKDFRSVWETACKKAGLPGRLLHDFRRTAVRNFIRAGIPEKVAMKLSGHKTRAIFDRYDICSKKDLEEAVMKLATYHNPAQKSSQPEASDTILTQSESYQQRPLEEDHVTY